MARKLAVLVPVVLLAACATMERPDSSNVSAYCTPQNAYHVGSQAKAYFGGCPKETETAFLQGLQRGREIRIPPPQVQPYFDRMARLEGELIRTSAEADRERIRTQLREAEFWAVHIINSPATYSNGP